MSDPRNPGDAAEPPPEPSTSTDTTNPSLVSDLVLEPAGEADPSLSAPLEAALPATAATSAESVVALLTALPAELEAILDPTRRAALATRLALAADLLGDGDRARALAESAAAVHPLARRLLVGHALAAADPEVLERAAAMVRALPETERPLLLRELAEAWLYRVGDPARALELLAGRPAADVELAELRALALAAAGRWKELGGVLGVPGTLAEAAHILDDRLDDPGGAAEALTAAGDSSPADRLFAVERLLELAARVPTLGVDPRALLRVRASSLPPGPDAQAARLHLALRLQASGATAEALPLLSALAREPDAGLGTRVALAELRLAAAAAAAWPEAAAAARRAADAASDPTAVRAARRRAAEILDARVGDDAAAAAAWAELAAADPADASAVRARDRLRLARGEHALLIRELEADSRHPARRAASLRRAAALAETRGGDLDAAIRLREASFAGAEELGAVAELARLLVRRGDLGRAALVYRQLAALAGGDECSAYHCAAALAELLAGRPADAEEELLAATRRAPDDPCGRMIHAAVCRAGARWRDLAGILASLAGSLASPTARAGVLAELGRITGAHLNDPLGARVHLEAALVLAPEHAGVLGALAELADGAGDFATSIGLRQRALSAATSPARAAAILVEIGGIEERHRHDDAAAERAYQSALERSPRSRLALAALAALLRRARRFPELIAVLRRELEVGEDPARRLAVLLEIGRLGEQTGEPSAALAAYQAALELEPRSAPAAGGVARICRRENRWDALAAALAPAPPTPENLRFLAEALERLGRFRELAGVRRRQIEAAEPAEALAATLALAALLTERLDDRVEAAAVLRAAAAAAPTDPRPLAALGVLLAAAGDWRELGATLERQLALLPPADAERRPLLLQLGAVRRDRLAAPAEAAAAFAAALELAPKDAEALAALEALYTSLGREEDLLGILERRAEAHSDRAARASAFARIAEIRERRGQFEAALVCSREAFLAEPSNRDLFTSLERLCYHRERWRDALELYDAAIAQVENGWSHSYRLGDLYARRGQVLLQYLGQPAEAAASFLRVIELDPENEQPIRLLESLYAAKGDWQGLIRAHEKRSELVAEDAVRVATLHRAVAIADEKLQDPAEALRLLDRILAIAPGDPAALGELERRHTKGGDWNRLIDVLGLRLTTLGSANEQTTTLLRIATICEEHLRDERRSIDSYRRVLDLVPTHKDALDALARIYESTERWAEFIDIVRRQIRVITDRQQKALLYFKCGSVMESKFNKEDEAIRYYEAAIKTAPTCLPAVHGLRDLHLRRKDWAKVIDTLELEVKLWQDEKERAGVYAQLGHIHGEHLHDSARALRYFQGALKADPESLPANRALFEHHFSRGEFVDAKPLLIVLSQKAMREGDPSERSEFYRKRGVVLARTGEAKEAADSFHVALKIRPENLDALEELRGLARASPDVYDFPAVYGELEKLHRGRDDNRAPLAHVLVGEGTLFAAIGDIDTALRLFGEARSLAPDDPAIVLALVDLEVALRHFAPAADLIRGFLTRSAPTREARVRGLARLAEIHGDCEMDPTRAAGVLRELLGLDPTNEAALFRLAQELYLSGRYAEARQHVERVIELAAAPGTNLAPAALARFTYYLGRILDALGDARGAGSQYRRAAEYDPTFAPPALALARRALHQGDRRTGERILIDAAHAAMAERGPAGAVPLQRGLARILLATGDRHAAIDAYRGILAVEDSNDDRVALAEIYALDDAGRAVLEVRKVLDRDLRHAPAYRLLLALYERSAQPDRALRVASILELLGYSDDAERRALGQMRAGRGGMARRAVLSEELRAQLLLPAAARSILAEIYANIAEQVAGLFLMPPPGVNPVPVEKAGDAALAAAAADCGRLFAVPVDFFVADAVPGGVVALLFPRPTVTISRELAGRPDGERRFLLGRACESIRGGYAPLLRMGVRERGEVGGLLTSLLLPEAERSPEVKEFVHHLPRKAAKGLERFAAGVSGAITDAEAWFTGLELARDRAGLLACDDFGACARSLALLSGEELAVGEDGAVALGAIPGGTDLVRFYLSEEYQRVRSGLDEARQG